MLDRALMRLQRMVPREFDDKGSLSVPAAREEVFTREIVLLAVLGPATGTPGPIRDQMLVWLTARDSPSVILRDAAGYCLALASRTDEALAGECLRIADSLDDLGRARLLKALAMSGAQRDLVVQRLGTAVQEVRFRDDPLAQAEAMNALTIVLECTDPGTRAAATKIVVDGILDPEMSAQDRMILLHPLAATRSESLYDVGQVILNSTSDPDTHQAVILNMYAVRPEQEPQTLKLLIAMDSSECPLKVRKAIVSTVSKLGGPEAKEYLSTLASGKAPDDLRAEASRQLERLRLASMPPSGR